MRNIAQFGYAFQSSLSKWSTSDDEANNALTGKSTNGYAFHTMSEKESWWIVDLGRVHSIFEINVYLRPNFIKRQENIYISVSNNLTSWENLGKIDISEDGKLGLKQLLYKPVRFVKLSVENYPLHLQKVEIIEDETIIPFRNVLIHDDILLTEGIRKSLINGSYELSEINCVLFNSEKDDIILELGASIGAMSVIINKNRVVKDYWAVEANPFLIELIRENHKINNISCTIIHGAISDKGGIATFHLSNESTGSSLVSSDSRKTIVKVPQIEFNCILKESNANFIVCDIEGAEYIIFNNEVDLSKVNKICIEMHPYPMYDSSKLFKYFISKGFNCNSDCPNSSSHGVFFFSRKLNQ